MSSPSNNAAREAQRAEDARLAQIRNTQNQINRVFDDPRRATDIQNFVSSLRQFKLGDLNDQKALADRQLKFALARKGVGGGSTQVDQQADLMRDYQRGVLRVDQQAQGAGADLMARDEDARARLIQLATSGLDASTGAARSAAALRTNIQGAQADARAQGLDSMFGAVADFARRSREESDRRRGLQASGFSLYGSTGYGGGP